jgi:hypothetical protein
MSARQVSVSCFNGSCRQYKQFPHHKQAAHSASQVCTPFGPVS